jgi:hypothetical protein
VLRYTQVHFLAYSFIAAVPELLLSTELSTERVLVLVPCVCLYEYAVWYFVTYLQIVAIGHAGKKSLGQAIPFRTFSLFRVDSCF